MRKTNQNPCDAARRFVDRTKATAGSWSDRLDSGVTVGSGGDGFTNTVIQPTETRRANEAQEFVKLIVTFREKLCWNLFTSNGDSAIYAVALGSAKSITDHLTTLDETAKVKIQRKVSDNHDLVPLKSIEAPGKTYSIITAKSTTMGSVLVQCVNGNHHPPSGAGTGGRWRIQRHIISRVNTIKGSSIKLLW